jgi:hypothetical protein
LEIDMRADSLVYPLASAASVTGAAVPIRGGRYMALFDGTAGGSTVSLQIQCPDGTWSTVGALGGNAVVQTTTLPYSVTPIDLPAGNVRAAITGGAGVSLNAWLGGIG